MRGLSMRWTTPLATGMLARTMLAFTFFRGWLRLPCTVLDRTLTVRENKLLSLISFEIYFVFVFIYSLQTTNYNTKSTNSQFGSISAVTLMFFLSYVDVLCGWLIIGSVKSNLLGTICPAIISLSTSFFSRSSKAESIGMKNVWRPGWSNRLNWFIDLTWLEKFLLKKDINFPGENLCVFTFCDIKVRDKKIGNSEQIMQPSHSGSFWTKRYKKYETCHGTFSIIIEFARILMFVANTLKVHKNTKSCFFKKKKKSSIERA